MPVTGTEPVSTGNLKAAIESLLGGGGISDSIYPVGSIYLSVSATDPGTLFGGTWQRIQDRFLLCAGTSYAAGSTGGEATHTLTLNEMPSHTHGLGFDIYSNDGGRGLFDYVNFTKRRQGETEAEGSGQPHNNMPPYLAVYAWKRTA